jgi:photosystem II PsbJ protein
MNPLMPPTGADRLRASLPISPTVRSCFARDSTPPTTPAPRWWFHNKIVNPNPAIPWKSSWTEGVLPLWLVETAGGMAVLFVARLFFYSFYIEVGYT